MKIHFFFVIKTCYNKHVINMYDIENIKQTVKKLVNEERYNHCLLTGDAAKELAKKYNYDEKIAYIVGIAHDIAKDFSKEEIKKWADKYQLPKELLKDNYKQLIHADIGAIVCQEWFNFNAEMCRAIKYHTVPDEEMNLLDKIIFIADKIGRTDIPEDLKDLKEVALNNLDEAIILFLEKQQIMLKKHNRDLFPRTIKLLESLKKE